MSRPWLRTVANRHHLVPKCRCVLRRDVCWSLAFRVHGAQRAKNFCVISNGRAANAARRQTDFETSEDIIPHNLLLARIEDLVFFVDDRTRTFHGLDLACLTGIPFQPFPIAITEIGEVVSVSGALLDAKADQLALTEMGMWVGTRHGKFSWPEKYRSATPFLQTGVERLAGE